ncbi:MAG: PQQ-binding-like beta-propeller repeat protein [Pirellulales bacterium]
MSWLPPNLPDPLPVVWRAPLTASALGGVAATQEFVILADRDALDTTDIFRCLRAETGEEVWAVRELSSGHLDYGNSGRATPTIHGDLVFLYNAHGTLICVKLATGEVVWKKNLLSEFRGKDLTNAWGTSSSPLVVDDKLIVNPGGPEASVVALVPATGEVVWKTPGGHAAFASFIVGTFGNRRQIVGYERKALVGLDPDTGQQLWRLVPPVANDFNVPTPIAVDGKLLVTTENNGMRLYDFNADGTIKPEPIATNDELAPDTHTPIVLGSRVFGVWLGMQCVDLKTGLQTVWFQEDEAFDDYAVLVGCGDRALAVSKFGELILIDAQANKFQPIARRHVFKDDPGVLSHPAFVGTRMYLRGSNELVCLELKAEQAK